MKAKEMFRELKFKLIADNEKVLTYKNNRSGAIIKFQYAEKWWIPYYQDADNLIGIRPFNIKEHLAIHQQMKELGWLDE